MEALITGIDALFDGDSDLSTALSGGLFYEEAEGLAGSPSMPYGVFHLHTQQRHDTTESATTSRKEEFDLEFRAWSDERSRDVIMDVKAKLKALFDFAQGKITVTGWTCTRFHPREVRTFKAPGSAGEKSVWQLNADFLVRLHSN